MKVVGNQIFNDSGEVVILKGVNIADPQHLNTKPWERYGTSGKIVADKAIKLGATVIRIPVLPGDKKYPNEGWFGKYGGGNKYFDKHLLPLVEHITSQGVCVIIDLHYISNYQNLYEKVSSFWEFMAPKFSNNPYVLYEILNEPIGPDNWLNWKNIIAQPITDLIRKSAKNLVLIGGPYWSSHMGGAAENPIVGENIVYVGHIYPNQGKGLWWRYEEVIKKFPMFITEWGFEEGGTEGGNIKWGEPFVEWMNQHKLSWTAWCFDTRWGPRMVDSNWKLLKGDGFMGEFVANELKTGLLKNAVMKQCKRCGKKVKNCRCCIKGKVMQKFDEVKKPSHYNQGKYEVIDVLEDWGLDKNANLFNVVKYVSRAEHKGKKLHYIGIMVMLLIVSYLIKSAAFIVAAFAVGYLSRRST